MVTPLLNKIRTEGGTLYTFSSASKDLARVFTNDSYSFTFSHFACLNIPDLDKLNFDVFPHAPTPDKDGYDVALATHFQDYIMNFETAVLNGEGDDDGFDTLVLRSPAERIFFNWLRKVGGISFKKSDNGTNLYYETCDGYDYDPVNIENHSDYASRRTVQYIGMIDAVNSVEINGDTYSEVYLHIPSTVGSSYEVRFGSVLDSNYNGGEYSLPGKEKIIGRENIEDSQLSTEAIYDYDSKDDNSDELEDTYEGDAGFVIDFRDYMYNNSLIGYGDIMTMNENSADDFEFNCVLIYYSWTDNATGDTVTNLYGILLLDNVDPSMGAIQRYPKHKTTNLSGGNSFALKVDLKIDAYPTSNMSAVYENNNQELLQYFQEYADDMSKLQQTIDIFHSQQNEITTLQNRINELETLLFGMDKLSDISSRVLSLEERLNYSGLADQEELMELIGQLNQRIQDLVSGKIPVELQYNTDVIEDGYGIKTNKQDGKIVINTSIPSYSLDIMLKGASGEGGEIDLSNPLDLSTDSVVYTPLEEGTNLAVLYVTGDICTKDIDIYIDDSDIKWITGQAFELRINDYIDFDGFNLNIHTGNIDGTYMQNIMIAGEDIPYSPLVKIICINNVMNDEYSSFTYEVLSTKSYGDSGDVPSEGVITEDDVIDMNSLDDLINDVL